MSQLAEDSLSFSCTGLSPLSQLAPLLS